MTTAKSLLQAAGRRLTSNPLDLAGAVSALIYALPSLLYPFGTDHPVHWYGGRRLLDGLMPYAESTVSTKPPGVFLVHSVAILLFGDRMSSIRLVEMFFVIATGVMVATFRLRKNTPDAGPVDRHRRADGEIGAACLAIAVFHYTFFDSSDTGHPELWQGFFMLLSAWVIVRAPDAKVSWRRAFAAGAVACIAVTFKHVAFLTGVVSGAMAVAMWLSHHDLRRALHAGLAFTGGVLFVLALTVLPFVLTGTFEAFWEFMVEFILRYAKQDVHEHEGPPPWLEWGRGLLAVLVPLGLFWGGVAASAAARNKRQLWLALAIFALGASAVYSVSIQKRAMVSVMFAYHFVVIGPFVVLAAMWGVRRAFQARGALHLMVAVALLIAAVKFEPTGVHQRHWSYRNEWVSYVAYTRGERSWRQHHMPHLTSRLDSFVQMHDIAAYIRPRIREGDTMCVDGFILALYQLTGLFCPSRFISGDGATQPEHRSEINRMLDAGEPTFWVTFGNRPRVRQLERRGYTSHDLRYPNRSWYVVMERARDDGEEIPNE